MIKINKHKTLLKKPFFLIFLCLIFILVGEITIQLFLEYGLKIQAKQITTQSLKIGEPSFLKFFIIIFLAPFIETLFFQKFLVGFLKKYFSVVFCVLLSVILFALSHFYSILYLFKALYAGLVLTLAFLFFEKEMKSPVLNTSIIHMLRNAVAFAATFYF